MKLVSIASILLLFVSTCLADLSMTGVFSDHMVLQRDQPIPIWGTDAPGQAVTVSLGNNTASATADGEGRWRVDLAELPAGGPHELKVEGSDIKSFTDVLIGEVWVCSGQSNMAMTVSRCKDFEKEQANADHPNVRMFKVKAHATPEIQSTCEGEWQPASATTIGGFSASGWFFGRELHQELDVPIGLINTSWGGTDIASWTSRSAQETVPELTKKIEAYEATLGNYSAEEAQAKYDKAMERWEELAAKAKEAGKKPKRRPKKQQDPAVNQNRPANLFNGMLNPLIPYGIRGAIWYQGERNAKSVETGMLYATQLELMINDWRERFGQGDFPFITVQLPNFKTPQESPVETSGWVAVRASELASLRMKNTGLAITTDLGEAKDIHPKNKQDVGKRLALWALGTTYGKDIVYSGPLFSSMELKYPKVKKGKLMPGAFKLRFRHVGEDLQTSDGEAVRGFAVAGEDRVWHKAKAAIKDGVVTVSAGSVQEPAAVRYGWAANPDANLVNSAGLPASPFRTDDWDLVAEDVDAAPKEKPALKKAG